MFLNDMELSTKDFRTAPVAPQEKFASFPERVFSGVLDAVLLSVAETILICSSTMFFHGDRFPWSVLSHAGLPFLVSFLYYPMLESSAWQGTVGKKIFGLRVTDIYGKRFTITRAICKQALQAVAGSILFGSVFLFCTMYSDRTATEPTAAFYVGILVANLLYFSMHFVIIFTQKKQSLFDKMTGRLVYKRN